MISGSLCNYLRDEVNGSANENNDANNVKINNDKEATSKYFESKTKLIGTATNKIADQTQKLSFQ